jgi:hypothetical protein
MCLLTYRPSYRYRACTASILSICFVSTDLSSGLWAFDMCQEATWQSVLRLNQDRCNIPANKVGVVPLPCVWCTVQLPGRCWWRMRPWHHGGWSNVTWSAASRKRCRSCRVPSRRCRAHVHAGLSYMLALLDSGCGFQLRRGGSRYQLGARHAFGTPRSNLIVCWSHVQDDLQSPFIR